MMLVTTKKMLNDAKDGGYAVGAFNAENAEMVWAIVNAAEELKAPVIIQTTSSTLKYFSPAYFANLAKAAAESVSVPVAIHLDHGASFELAKQCIDSGYTSVMIDGSALPYEENICVTKKVRDYADNFGIPVESELGKIGGKEDDTESDGNQYTDPDQAADFVNRTGISSLAVAIGTAHGIYAKKPVLDFNRATLIKKVVSIPLVMHGASGLSDEALREGVEKGMSKINFATELRIAFTDAIKAHMAEHPNDFDPKKYLGTARIAVKELVKAKIQVCGSAGKA
ncbi:class II fructose-bisphosphate aldolase [Caproiciproducens sp. AGMB10547]|uniref:Class II fructose-bisphosphate aldolase n=1 Tax=Caproiciproducens faecalis TaxID=2820301 RepID=A0ABS7DPB2_9FIRM|nr:class II fructose-bisphosphate aldolase [Caproiciproducens faecalis]